MTTPSIDRTTANTMLRLAGEPTIEEFEQRIADAERRATLAATTVEIPMSAPAHEGLPELVEIAYLPAHQALGLPAYAKKLGGFKLPVFQWAHPHPMVPALNEGYVFRPSSLIPLCMGLVHNSRPWLHGSSGTGKTSLVAEVAARLRWPFMVVSLDSEIGRMDLIGRDTLVPDEETGQPVSKFVDGVFPRWLAEPCLICLDEVDFGRPDVMYVLQRVLDDKGLLLTEDGGRIVVPHRYSRIVATANTRGGGDDSGLYPGARVQSAAFLNRFQTWIHVEYMVAEQETAMLNHYVAGLDGPIVESIMRYVAEHREAFRQSKVMLPISPRNIIAIGRSYLFLKPILNDAVDAALMGALEYCVLNAASDQDRTILNGIAKRII